MPDHPWFASPCTRPKDGLLGMGGYFRTAYLTLVTALLGACASGPPDAAGRPASEFPATSSKATASSAQPLATATSSTRPPTNAPSAPSRPPSSAQ